MSKRSSLRRWFVYHVLPYRIRQLQRTMCEPDKRHIQLWLMFFSVLEWSRLLRWLVYDCMQLWIDQLQRTMCEPHKRLQQLWGLRESMHIWSKLRIELLQLPNITSVM